MDSSRNELNHPNIVLIAIRDNPSLVPHYQPISLWNVSYKIISKIMAALLKPIMSNLISSPRMLLCRIDIFKRSSFWWWKLISRRHLIRSIGGSWMRSYGVLDFRKNGGRSFSSVCLLCPSLFFLTGVHWINLAFYIYLGNGCTLLRGELSRMWRSYPWHKNYIASSSYLPFAFCKWLVVLLQGKLERSM